MNDSNTNPTPVELPGPRAAHEHVNLVPNPSVNLVPNPSPVLPGEVADSTGSPQPVEREVLPLPRLLVVGSPGWDIPEAVPRILQNWWNKNGKPVIELVVDDTPVGKVAARVWPRTELPVVIEPLSEEPLRRPERERKYRMLRGDVRRALVFAMTGDDHVAEWLLLLGERKIPTTLFRVDEVR